MHTDLKLTELTRWFGDWFLDGTTPQAGRMTQSLHPYTEMFSPIQVNTLHLKNRLVMAPIGNISMCEETGRPNEKMLAYFTERAKGGVGLITSGLVPISFGIDTPATARMLLTSIVQKLFPVFGSWLCHRTICDADRMSVRCNPAGNFTRYPARRSIYSSVRPAEESAEAAAV